MPLVKRLVKGSALTYAEGDGNLTYLDNKVTGSIGLIPVFDSPNTVTGSNVLSIDGNSVSIDGSLTITGDLTAMQYIISSSVSHFTESFSSGSTRFGDSLNDTHQFTGSLFLTGALSSSNGAYFTDQIVITHMTVGHGPSKSDNNTGIGLGVLQNNFGGVHNTAIGSLALFNNNGGNGNSALGSRALTDNISGSFNTAVGYNALPNNITGSSNTAIGRDAGFNATGSGNVFIGNKAGFSQTGGDNKLWISNTDTSTPLIKGDFTGRLLQFNTSTGGTQITGSLITTSDITTGGELNVNGTTVAFNVSPSSKFISFSDATDPFGNLVTLYLSGSSIVSKQRPYLQLGSKGLNINDKVNIISAGAQITGSLTVTGSSILSGSATGVVNSLSISSNTASLDLTRGNFFTLQLVGGTDTYINPSNIQSGQTVNILINTVGSATVSFPNTVLQPSGSEYIPTSSTGKDIITLVSFDSSNLYLANVKNFI